MSCTVEVAKRVPTTSRSSIRSTRAAVGSRLKKMRRNLLRAGKRVRGKARMRLNALIRAKGATARAWLLKESFEQFWSCLGMGWAMGFLDAWVSRARRSRLAPMQRAAHMLRSHRDLPGNYSGPASSTPVAWWRA
ncbi:MAG: transposase [Verrucomicrobiaceae bacterium]|nr:transposase [Verrucomicrobiaceae bacterium]